MHILVFKVYYVIRRYMKNSSCYIFFIFLSLVSWLNLNHLVVVKSIIFDVFISLNISYIHKSNIKRPWWCHSITNECFDELILIHNHNLIEITQSERGTIKNLNELKINDELTTKNISVNLLRLKYINLKNE